LGAISLAHGAGGKESWALIRSLIVNKVPEELRKTSGGYGLDVLDDGAAIKLDNKYLVITTDSFTVDPIEFPGGSIGTLAVHGSINDLVVMGADPLALMDSIIVEEGFDLPKLDSIIKDMVEILKAEGISLIGGDLKVMPKGSIDKLVIPVTGLGISAKPIVDTQLRPGDRIVVTSPLAEHGAAILAAQLGMLEENRGLKSDTRPLTKTVLPAIKKFRPYIHAARDPTRGGLAATLNEWASMKDVTIVINRSSIPLRDEVRDFLDAMGVDPLSTASEGAAVLGIMPEVVDDFINYLKKLGEVNAAEIGYVVEAPDPYLRGKVIAETEVGGKVLVEPKSINLPRIC